MNEKELRHRVERSQLELDYWRGRADQMRWILDLLETDYQAHRSACCLVRRRQMKAVVVRTLDIVAAVEGAGGGVSEVDDASSEEPTETSTLLTASQPSSTTSAAEYSRTVRRLANRSNLKCTTLCV